MAAATVVYKDAVVVIDSATWSAQINELGISYSAEMLDRTTFGDTTRNRTGGLYNASIDIKGLVSFGASAVEAALFPLVGQDSVVVAVFPTGLTEGSLCGYAMRGVEEHFNIGGAVGILLPFDLKFESAES